MRNLGTNDVDRVQVTIWKLFTEVIGLPGDETFLTTCQARVLTWLSGGPMRDLRPLIGLGTWILVLGLLGVWLLGQDEGGERRFHLLGETVELALSDTLPVCVVFAEAIPAETGDVLYERTGADFIPVGEVTAVNREVGRDTRVELSIYPRMARRLDAKARFTHFTATGTVAWAASTLLPRDKVELIARDARETFLQRRALVERLLLPHAEAMITSLWSILRVEAPLVLEGHRAEIQELLRKHHVEIVQQRLAPLWRSEIWPVVREEGGPVVRAIGEELWNELPKWALGFRLAVEQLPLVENGKASQRFQSYVKDEAVPILLTHADEILEAVQSISLHLAEDPEVGSVITTAFLRFIEDPATEDLFRRMIRELTLENERVRGMVSEAWSSPDFQDDLARALSVFENLVRRSVNAILLNESQDGINPDLARVLRTNILGRDRSWFLVEVDPSLEGAVIAGGPGVGPGHLYRGQAYAPLW